MPIIGQELGKRLVEALGLPKHTMGITLHVYPGQFVTVECKYALDEDKLSPLMAEYALVERGKPKSFDTWMRERTERAHTEFMERTSRRLPCDSNTEDVARYMGAPVR